MLKFECYVTDKRKKTQKSQRGCTMFLLTTQLQSGSTRQQNNRTRGIISLAWHLTP